MLEQQVQIGRSRELNVNAKRAVAWQCTHSHEVRIRERSRVISQLEACNAEMRKAGLTRDWLRDADFHTQQLSQHVNGPLPPPRFAAYHKLFEAILCGYFSTGRAHV